MSAARESLFVNSRVETLLEVYVCGAGGERTKEKRWPGGSFRAPLGRNRERQGMEVLGRGTRAGGTLPVKCSWMAAKLSPEEYQRGT